MRGRKSWADLTSCILVLAIAVSLVLLGLWGCWLLWTFVMPEVWPTGPQGVVNPGYWLFVCEWVLVVVAFRLIRGRK